MGCPIADISTYFLEAHGIKQMCQTTEKPNYLSHRPCINNQFQATHIFKNC
jgi:hypothetical protein